jgi:hypothetical protein
MNHLLTIKKIKIKGFSDNQWIPIVKGINDTQGRDAE